MEFVWSQKMASSLFRVVHACPSWGENMKGRDFVFVYLVLHCDAFVIFTCFRADGQGRAGGQKGGSWPGLLSRNVRRMALRMNAQHVRAICMLVF